MEKALDRAFDSARKIAFDIDRDKFVVMSDQHIGDGKKGSDDFRLNCPAYKKALAHYFDSGYRFISIGDSEELWECDFPKIRSMYPEVYSLERKFSDSGRLFRLYGNHDIFWRRDSFVKEYLGAELPGITFCEALLLQTADGNIFLTHGHQGDFLSDALWPASRFFVRNVWKPAQRLFGVKSTGAARNIKKRGKTEQTFYRWAKKKRVLFIAGHTHRAMFGSLSKIDRIRIELEELVQDTAGLSRSSSEYRTNMEKISEKKTALKARMEKEFGQEPEIRFEDTGISSPCYFNDGCCSYDNGITAMEIESGMIRLVKWERVRDEQPARRNVYEEDRLRELFIKIELY